MKDQDRSQCSFGWSLDLLLAPMSWNLFVFAAIFYNFLFLPRILPANGGGVVSAASSFLFFNAALGMALWSYLMALFADPGVLPQRWVEFTAKAERRLSVQASLRAWQPGVATWCSACMHVRPERAHHCDKCDICVLRMDHHCPAIMNCVGFRNHKYFLLLLLYTVLVCVVGVLTSLPELLRFFGPVQRVTLSGATLPNVREFTTAGVSVRDVTMLVLFDAVALIMIFICSPTLMLCGHQAMCDETHIETLYENRAKNPYDTGDRTRNLAQIMGKPGYDWLLPLPSRRHPLDDGPDGCSFLRNDVALPSDYETVERLWSVRYDVAQPAYGRLDPPCIFACRVEA